MTISLKGSQYLKSVIRNAVFFYVRDTVSYRDQQEILLERGITVDPTTLNQWVMKCSSLIAIQVRQRKAPSSQSWRIDETYVKVKGQWLYQYRAIDKFGKILGFVLSERRDEAAATDFFKRTIKTNGIPAKVDIDKSGANYAGLRNMNILFLCVGFYHFIDILQLKYLNNLIEQSHRFIKKIINPMRGFQSFATAAANLDPQMIAVSVPMWICKCPNQSRLLQPPSKTPGEKVKALRDKADECSSSHSGYSQHVRVRCKLTTNLVTDYPTHTIA